MRVTQKDAVIGHFTERYCPTWLLPYVQLARLERPIGWWLLLLPGLWALALSAQTKGVPLNFYHMALMMLGAIVMRGAGCVYNDIVDRDLDAQVERTRLRPLPSKRVSVKQALIFMLLLAFTGLVVLLQFNGFTIILGLSSLGVVALYPFMKRFTQWPQLVLGFAFSWGALVGWAATFEKLSLPAFLVYGASILWVIGYDTIYAHQDKQDDGMIGIGSTALLFGKKTKLYLSSFYSGTILLMACSFWLANAGVLSWIGLLAFALHLAYQVWTLDISSPENCLKLFRSNRDAGLIITAFLVLDNFF